MKTKHSLFLGVCLLGMFCLSGPALAIPPAPEYCNTKCSAANCYAGCYDLFLGQASTCAAFLNRNQDYDADGVPYTSDNCACHANSNQANCDGDSRGDVCDSLNEKWVLVQDLGRCEWDDDDHAWGWTVEQYGAKRYQNVCNNAYCVDRYLISSVNCSLSYGNPGNCCDSNYPLAWCIGGTCGSPNCPF